MNAMKFSAKIQKAVPAGLVDVTLPFPAIIRATFPALSPKGILKCCPVWPTGMSAV